MVSRDPSLIPWAMAKAPVTAGGDFSTANATAAELRAVLANLPRVPRVRIRGVVLGYDKPGLGAFSIGGTGTPWSVPIGPGLAVVPLDLGVVDPRALQGWVFAGAVAAGGTSSLFVALLLDLSPQVQP